MALGLTQPVLGAELTLSGNLETSTSRNHKGPSMPVYSLLYFYTKQKSRRLYSSTGVRGEQIRGDRSPWRSHFVR
jgi:hypothetical protein